MTEINSAEVEAEKILSDVYPEARAEICPAGKDCGVHFRMDEEVIEEDGNFARIITYAGEFVVLTDDNPEIYGVGNLLAAVLGLSVGVPRWETSIYHVGAEGVIGDIETSEQARAACRYKARHDSWEEVRASHHATVMHLQQGVIDASKPLEG